MNESCNEMLTALENHIQNDELKKKAKNATARLAELYLAKATPHLSEIKVKFVNIN